MPDGTIQRVQTVSDGALVTLTDPDAIKQAAMESLVAMMQSLKGDARSLGVVREILDRLDGRPVSRAIVATTDTDVAKRLERAIERRKLIDVTPK